MTTMKRYPLLLIALVASVLICIQNLSILGGFVWALIHGAGARSFVAFVPAALALVVLWAGYRVIRSRVTGRYMTFAFLAYAIGVVVLNEMLLPATPLKDWSGRRALEGVRVLRVRDEPLLSARGNPIGVRISFDGVVQRTDAYLIGAATLASASGETIWPLHFGNSAGHHVEPAPTKQSHSPYDVFQKDITYTFTQDMLPNFLRYDETTKTLCLAEVRTKYISEADFVAALAANRDIGLRVEILVEGEGQPMRALVFDGVTSRRYDMQAMLDTISKEGLGRCRP